MRIVFGFQRWNFSSRLKRGVHNNWRFASMEWATVEVDSLWRALGTWGKFQAFQVFLVALDYFPAAYAILSPVFTGRQLSIGVTFYLCLWLSQSVCLSDAFPCASAIISLQFTGRQQYVCVSLSVCLFCPPVIFCMFVRLSVYVCQSVCAYAIHGRLFTGRQQYVCVLVFLSLSLLSICLSVFFPCA